MDVPVAPLGLDLPEEFVLGFTGAANARDLGGHIGSAGRRVRRGRLFRAGALNRLTDADVARLGDLRLACLVDFRHPDEIGVTGADRLPLPAPSRVVSLPVFHLEHDVFIAVGALLSGSGGPEVAEMLRDDHDSGGAAAVMHGLYRWFVSDPAASASFAEAMRLVATADALPMLFHCTAGKDRTGWLAAVILSALGVERDAVVRDYLRSNDLNAAASARLLASIRNRLSEPDLLVPLLEARAEYLHEAFDEVERRYGGMAAYLRDGLELDDDALAALRANLLDPPASGS